jgi:hypothetical protein
MVTNSLVPALSTYAACRTRVIGNVVFDIRNLTLDRHATNPGGQALYCGEAVQWTVLNNAVVGAVEGFSAAPVVNTSLPTQNAGVFAGNLISRIEGTTAATQQPYHLSLAHKYSLPVIRTLDSCYWQPAGDATLMYGKPTYYGGTIVSSLADALSNPAIGGAGFEAGSFAADPLFVNEAKRDFRLSSSSPCRNAGNDLSALLQTEVAAFFEAWGLDLTGDECVNSRLLDGLPDVGAFEYDA